MRVRLALFVLIAAISATTVLAEEPTLSPDELKTLIQKLGSAKFSEREAATRRLALLDEIPPELQNAAKSGDAEVSRRAKSIVARILKRNEKRIIEKELAAINRMGFDRFVDRMVLSPGFASEQRWQALVRATEAVVDRANKLGYTGTPLPQIHWADLPLIEALPQRYTQSSRVLIDGHTERFTGFRTCFAVSSGSIERMSSIQDSILIVNGEIPRLNRVFNSLIICTGEIGPISNLRNSIVLTTGSFDGASSAHNSLVQANKMNRRPSGEANVFVNLGKAPEGETSRYIETEKSPLAALTLFSPRMLGLSVRVSNSEAWIDDVAAKSVFATAGLRKGDQLLSIDGTKWSSDDEFRTLLRKKSAHSPATLTVRRGNKELSLPAKFEE